jgi:hypothetical protein
MQQQKQQRVKDIDKQIIKISLIETPGSILFGVGLYSKFVGKGEAILPFLQDQAVVNSIIVIGAAIMLWGTYKILMLKQEKARLQKSAQ